MLGGQGVGTASTGRNREQAYVNAATGNLVVQQIDDSLSALGLNLTLARTYNSQGVVDGDNNDNWRIGVYERVYNLTGTRNTTGSTVTKTFGDGADVVYTYNTSLGKYVGRDGDGANDTLSYINSTAQWTWTNGSTRATETYNANGQLLNSKDVDGNTVNYRYAGSLLTSITDASGQQTLLDYRGNNLSQIRVVSSGQTQTLTRYTYDFLNRLQQVTVDLTPSDNSIADGKTYVTTYGYDGWSKRLTSIVQSDGSSVSFTYQSLSGQYRVKTQTVTAATGVTRTTTFNYSSYSVSGGVYQQTDIIDPLNLTTTYKQDTSGRLIAVLSPTVGAARLETDYSYDSTGHVSTVTTDPAGVNRVTTYIYDSSGNLTLSRDAMGNTVTRTFDGANKPLTETSYQVRDPDGAGSGLPSSPLTTRYAYDSKEQLRFIVSADGRVTEYRYNASGQRLTSLRYVGASYNVGALPASTPTAATALTEATLQTWAAAQDQTQLERVDYAYDFRSQVTSLTAWTTTDSTGAGTGTPSITQLIYDQRGQLLQTLDGRGSATVPNASNPNLPYATTYTYDGLGRVLSTIDWIAANGNTPITRTMLNQYDDANNRTVTTLANGLVTTSTYDQAGELTSVVNTGPGAVALGTTSYKYDADGRLKMVTDPTGLRTFYLYDEASRPVANVDPMGALTELVYDKASELIKTIRYATALSSTALASLVLHRN